MLKADTFPTADAQQRCRINPLKLELYLVFFRTSRPFKAETDTFKKMQFLGCIQVCD